MQTASADRDPIAIDSTGDLLLAVSDATYPDSSPIYRVNSDKLRTSSRYFDILLDPSKFSEGVKIADKLRQLRADHVGNPDIHVSDLPVVSIKSVGRVGKLKSINGLMKDFLLILHDEPISSTSSKLPLSNLANLVVVADHFDALQTLKDYVRRNNFFIRVSKSESSSRKSVGPIIWNNTVEEATRMRILVGILLDHAPWVNQTEDLIVRGSKNWSAEVEHIPTASLWWNLPQGLEEELQFRRQAILETITNLLSTLLTTYATPSPPQCKMGFATSRNCDVYQLGELVRFLNSLGLLPLSTTMAGMPVFDPYENDIEKAIRALKAVPPYQIDSDHHHCGPRDRLRDGLAVIESALPRTAICIECWNNRRADVRWIGAKKAISKTKIQIGKPGPTGFERGSGLCTRSHNLVRDFFLAETVLW